MPILSPAASCEIAIPIFNQTQIVCVCVSGVGSKSGWEIISDSGARSLDVNVDQKSIITQVEWGLIRPICLSEWTFNHGERFVSGLERDQFGSIFDLTAFIYTCLRL